MTNCKYQHNENYVVGWYGYDRPIYASRAVCWGQKEAPRCSYKDVNECPMAKPETYTHFDRICDGGPEKLAKFIIECMEEATKNPKVINYDGILAALNSEVKK